MKALAKVIREHVCPINSPVEKNGHHQMDGRRGAPIPPMMPPPVWRQVDSLSGGPCLYCIYIILFGR